VIVAHSLVDNVVIYALETSKGGCDWQRGAHAMTAVLALASSFELSSLPTEASASFNDKALLHTSAHKQTFSSMQSLAPHQISAHEKREVDMPTGSYTEHSTKKLA